MLGCLNTTEGIPFYHVPVKDMITPSGEWNWTVFKSNLPLPLLLSISAYKPPSTCDMDDFVGWKHEKKCVFSVRTAYSISCGVGMAKSGRFWHQIWHLSGPQKVRVFFWLAYLNKILTNHNRVRRNLTPSGSYMICGSLTESIDHVLRFRTPTVATWILVIKPKKRDEFFSIS